MLEKSQGGIRVSDANLLRQLDATRCHLYASFILSAARNAAFPIRSAAGVCAEVLTADGP